MLKLLTAQQIREADAHTIANKPISSADLMEAASGAFVQKFTVKFPERNLPVSVYCGTGNNGGDGLAIARLLQEEGYSDIRINVARFSGKSSPDFNIQQEKIKETGIPVRELNPGEELPSEDASVIIDALLGSGLNKPLEGDLKNLVQFINSSGAAIVSVDSPTGFFTEGKIDPGNVTIKADLVITFQRPKINFLLPESVAAMDSFDVADIGLDEAFIQKADSPYWLVTEDDVRQVLHKRHYFTHKGTYGHALLLAGADETMGAALLTAGACLFTGAGLTTACIPSSGLTALNTRYPEVMAVLRDKTKLQEIKWDKFDAIGAGPGLGRSEESKKGLQTALRSFKKPVVIDADAINIISANYELMQLVPEGSVFTPHVKEFDRLFGEHTNWWDRLETGIDRAVTLGCVIVLKNQYTVIFTPSGECIFNPTGGPQMATGGMGDVLTGVITSFLAQGYAPVEAAIAGVYLHGKAGNELVEESHPVVIPAGRLIEKLPEVIGAFS